LSQEIAHRITEFLHEKLSENIGIITCTHVELSDDNRHAKVWISVYPPQKELTDIDVTIRPVKQDLINFVKKMIPMKYFPHFEFILDTSADTMAKLDRVSDNNDTLQ